MLCWMVLQIWGCAVGGVADAFGLGEALSQVVWIAPFQLGDIAFRPLSMHASQAQMWPSRVGFSSAYAA